jgi:hypothetical protein
MPFLICTFASERSRPEKIRRWIAYLDELQHAHRDSVDRRHAIAILRSRASGWLEAKSA